MMQDLGNDMRGMVDAGVGLLKLAATVICLMGAGLVIAILMILLHECES